MLTPVLLAEEQRSDTRLPEERSPGAGAAGSISVLHIATASILHKAVARYGRCTRRGPGAGQSTAPGASTALALSIWQVSWRCTTRAATQGSTHFQRSAAAGPAWHCSAGRAAFVLLCIVSCAWTGGPCCVSALKAGRTTAAQAAADRLDECWWKDEAAPVRFRYGSLTLTNAAALLDRCTSR